MISDPLKGLKPQERAACLIAEKVLGATAQAWDVGGRQGEVDAMLTLPNGSRAAFEVTAVAKDGALHLESVLGKTDFEWPAVGAWWWDITVGSIRDVPELRRRHRRIIELCEQVGARRPEQLHGRCKEVDPDIRWLVEESTSSMLGHPDVAAVDDDRVRNIMVMPNGRGGGVDWSLTGLKMALEDAFVVGHMPTYLAKTARAQGDQRHLFLVLHQTALPFAVMDALMLGDSLPGEPPPIPPKITHLWLAPSSSRRVLLWASGEWQNHHPYDDDAPANGDASHK